MTAETEGSDPRELAALRSVRLFSIMAIIGYVFSTISFVISVSYIWTVIPEIGRGNISHIGPALMFSVVLSIVGFIILILSILFMREGYGLLKGNYPEFRSPYEGTTLYFSGLVVILVGIVIVVSSSILGFPVVVLAGGIFILAGGVVGFVGIILSLIVGIFRLDAKYGGFATAAVLFIFGLFFPVFSFVAAALVYHRTTKKITELSGQQAQGINS
ncbi:MAG: DUF973 family protein [Thermoplasmata archaeon]